MRALAATAVASLILTAGVRAAAQGAADVQTVRVDYAAPASCPARAWFEGALHFRSRRVIAVDATRAAAFDAKVVVEPTTNGFHGALRMTPQSGEPTVREIDGARCASVVEALAFTAALLLDPEGINTATLPSDTELAQIAETARAEAPASRPPEPAGEPRPSSPASPDRVTSIAPPLPPRFRFFGELGAGAWTAIAGAAARAHLGLEVRYEGASRLAPSGRLTAFGGVPAEESSTFGTVSYVPTGGRVDLGMLVRVGTSLRAGGGVHLTTLVMPVDAPSAQERRPSLRAIPSTGVAARASWEPSWWGLALETSGGANFVRESFVIETRDDPSRTGEVFRVPAFYVQATIAWLVHFGDLHGPLGR
ncbi:MAG: hypothetical protein KF819_32400 [Labilithrix sp.]|nr:hypothetical protein [Labilithrix sp.]